MPPKKYMSDAAGSESSSLKTKSTAAGVLSGGIGIFGMINAINAGNSRADALEASAENDILTIARITEMMNLNIANLEEDRKKSEAGEFTDAAMRGTRVDDSVMLDLAYQAIEEKNMIKLNAQYQIDEANASAKAKREEAQAARTQGWIDALEKGLTTAALFI